MDLVYLTLSTYAISYVLIYTEGPGGMLYKLRNNASVSSIGILECFACTAFWIALFLSLIMFTITAELFFHLFASMGGAIAIDSLRE